MEFTTASSLVWSRTALLVSLVFLLHGCSSAPPEEPVKEPVELDDWWGGATPTIMKEGTFEFDSTASGVGLENHNYKLSNWDWDFEPWMRQFENELHRHWEAPYAYRLGVVSGSTNLLVTIGRDGQVQAVAVIDQEGHESLHLASVEAISQIEGLDSLPPDFGDEILEVTLRLSYPAWR